MKVVIYPFEYRSFDYLKYVFTVLSCFFFELLHCILPILQILTSMQLHHSDDFDLNEPINHWSDAVALKP